jgi:dihydroflavonol-4-reductase
VDVEDVVDHLLLLAESPKAKGEAFFCASEESRTVGGMMREIVELLGLKPRTVPVPQALLAAIGAAADVVSMATGKTLRINRKLARQLFVPGWQCSIEKSKAMLGWTPKVRIRDSLERSVESYRQLGWI